jgi:hypothetical protein
MESEETVTFKHNPGRESCASTVKTTADYVKTLEGKDRRPVTALLIKLNRVVGNISCTLCGRVFEAQPGPELFTDVPRGHVCRDCARTAAPELAALLEFAKASEVYVDALLVWADEAREEDSE